MNKSKLILLATTAAIAASVPALAFAQAQGETLDTVVVTARKKSEDILKVPVAVTAFTGADLVTRDIRTPQDLANFTPSLQDNVSAAGGARVDRSSQLFIIRGMNPSNSLNPTTSTFINGVPVASSNLLQSLIDLDHVEVLKGPQSAYFGRETFAGAINAVSTIAGNKLAGDVLAQIGSRNTYNLSANVTVPIISDKLSIRAGYYYDRHDGSYKNAANPSQTLGDQSTTAGHVAITAKPIDHLTIKAFGLILVDKDGPEATGLLLANGPAAFNQSNCTINSTAFFCGTLPNVNPAVSPAENTTITAAQKAFFNNPGGIISSGDLTKRFGLIRHAYHADLNVDYVLPNWGLTLTYLGGFNRDNFSSISDLANIDGAAGGQYPGYAGFPYLVESNDHDYSHEIRLATDQTRRLRGLIGFSYIDTYHVSINDSLGGASIAPAPLGAPGKSMTSGFFFSAAFDILQNLTLNFDGRFQSDKEQSLNVAQTVVAQGTSNDFLPRVSLQYTFTPGMMAYATYSQGVNPGVFNTQYNALPAASQAELTASGSAGTLAVKPEELENYEVGVKGRFWNGRATFSAAAYYDNWTNQLNAAVFYFAPGDPANPYNVAGSTTYRPGLNSQYIYSSTNNSAASRAKGIEFEGSLIPIEHLTLNIAGSVNDTKYTSFVCTSCSPFSTSAATAPQTSGKRLPNAPEFTSVVGVEYARPTSFLHASDWFVRADYIYRDGFYIQSTNTVKTEGANTVNLRAGVNWKSLSVEGYISNLFDDNGYTAGFQNSNFAGFFAPAVMVGLPQLRTGGIRLRYTY